MNELWIQFTQIMPYAVAYAIPLLIAALGGLYSERGGISSLGLEGIMVMGAFAAAITIKLTQPALGDGALWLGLLAAVVIGTLFSLLHALASISLNANQTISGTALNMIAAALAGCLARIISGSSNVVIERGFMRFDVPLLCNIPIIGKLFFSNTYMTTWIVLAILLVSWFVLYKTPYGMRLRACGEHPQAADAACINVYKIRYSGVLMSGALAGLGGGIFLATYAGESSGSVGGIGFLALAALIFGQWKPLGILCSTMFFGLAMTIANVSRITPAFDSIPGVVLKTFPYIITLVALVLFSKSSQAPRALGEPFDKGKR